MKIHYILLFILLSINMAAYADTNVLVTTSIDAPNKVQLSYPDKVRLEQIIQDSLEDLPIPRDGSLSNQALYWLGAALLDMKEESIVQDKLNVLNALSALMNSARQRKNTDAFASLYNTLNDLTIAKRVLIPLDQDLVQIQLEYNPMIEGDYQLILPYRPSNILILGAVEQPGAIAWEERASANTYIQLANPLSISENSFAWVIQPDGNVKQHPITYWNESHQDVAPGAIIFLGFNSLLTNFSSLNESIVELLRNSTL